MVAEVKFGHRWSLHEKGSKPEFGFGYPNAGDGMTREEVEARAKEWSELKKASCAINAASCASCQLCDKVYEVTDLNGEQNAS